MNDAVLKGDLQFVSLPDVLQLLGSNCATGSLHISCKYAQSAAVIYFDKGTPIQAVSGELTDLEAIYSLFAWSEGVFEFRQPHIYRNHTPMDRRIQKNPMEIILEGLRLLDDGHIQPLKPVTIEHVSEEAGGILTELPVIQGTPVEYMDIVAEDMFHDGDKIVSEGKHGNWIWVILEGQVDIVKEMPHGHVSIVRVGPGGFIGSLLSFLFEGNIRSATVIARGDVQLGVLNSQRLCSEYALMSAELKRLLISIDRRLRQITNKVVEIRNNPVVSDAVNAKLSLLWKQGRARNELYEILNGSAFAVHTAGNDHRILCELHQGDFFGSTGFIDIGQGPDMASILATKELKVRQVDSDMLRDELERLSPTFQNLVHHISLCISITSMLACGCSIPAHCRKARFQ
ncbi:MAG: cyclic nucleotide-binding domain-containing protein [Desulfobacterales bacterium]|nr:cyclic nucleotide-binding domain-containing protein [Desulfobacterales bacterium]MDD4073496.1 cyclic nucleotide-binding domain-containing protein [Desulfobacterales bacterium]MDD4393049.1 cyclic nucleotide-binding domain-containing protein [Desulfobacterales bacterium]